MNRIRLAHAVSTRLILWGDDFDPAALHQSTESRKLKSTIERKGEEIRSSSPRSRIAKTGMLSVRFDDEKNRFEPEKQFSLATLVFRDFNISSLGSLGVDRAAFQMSVYYEEKEEQGEWDLTIPSELLSILANLKVEMNLTVMP